MWLCDDTLLCLLDPEHEENITGFQDRWKRGQVGEEVVIQTVTLVDRTNKRFQVPSGKIDPGDKANKCHILFTLSMMSSWSTSLMIMGQEFNVQRYS